MNTTWQVICTAIGESILGKKKEFPDNVDWNEVFREAKNQAVTLIVYTSIASYLPENIKVEWKLYNLQVVSHFVQVIHEENELVQLLSSHSIPICILKGTSAAIYYPEPQLRTMGDIDFIIPEEFFSITKNLLLENDYILDINEEKNPRHISLMKNGILYEMHHYFGDEKIDYYIHRCMDSLVSGKIRDLEFPMLPPLENGIVLLEHLRQHLLEGVGIRQFLDWMMYVDRVLDDIFWKDVFEAEVKKLGLKTLAMQATRMCQIYFGLSKNITWCVGADDAVCERLMANIIQSGNFGNNLGVGQSIEKTAIRLKKEGYFRYIQKAGEYNWEAYKRYHWLKPFAWIYQLGRYGRQLLSTGRKGKELKTDYDRSKERYRLLKDLGIMKNGL